MGGFYVMESESWLIVDRHIATPFIWFYPIQIDEHDLR